MSLDLRHRLRGIVTAAVVPFREGGGLDEDGYAQNVDRIMSTGRVAGILANGHTGEILSLSRSERKRTVAICREVVGDRGIVMGGVHGQSTWETLESMQDAAEAGADCCEVFSPF